VLRNGDGSGRVALTQTYYNCGVNSPAIAPDASVVVYTNGCDQGRLHRVNTDGSGDTPLTPPDYFMTSAAFSDDGAKIAAYCYSFSTNAYGICTMNADGTNVQLVLPSTDTQQWDQPSWSPDGDRLAVAGYANGEAQIFVAGSDGSSPQQVTSDGTDNIQPRWLPDGDIAYIHYNPDNTSDIRVTSPDTTAPTVNCGSADGSWHGDDVTIACTASDDGSGLADPADTSFGLSTTVPAGTETASAATGTHQVCDRAGNCTTAGPIDGNEIDKKAPQVTCGAADGVWHAVDVSIGCTATDGGSGLASSGDASFSLSTNVPAGTETSTAQTNTHVVQDQVGNSVTAGPIGGNQIDKKAPQVTCGAADGVWHAVNVSIACTATDGGSGLASSGDASFSLSTNVPAGTETATAQTNSRVVQDQVGNSAPAGPIPGNKIDRKAPTIAVTTPPQNVNYVFRQPVAANYACTDPGSGVQSCTGTVANGANIPTSTPGAQTFTVTARDNVGNVAPTVTRNYTVTFTFQGFSYPQNQPVINVVQSGRITPARFNLVDYFGTTIYNTYGLNIFVGGSPSSGGITCPTGTTYNATQTASAGLRYDTTNRRYEYGFTTSTAWAGTCRVLTLKFRDGAQQKLTYKFR
jgi:hypothetical protein